jgi:hypothetical protein
LKNRKLLQLQFIQKNSVSVNHEELNKDHTEWACILFASIYVLGYAMIVIGFVDLRPLSSPILIMWTYSCPSTFPRFSRRWDTHVCELSSFSVLYLVETLTCNFFRILSELLSFWFNTCQVLVQPGKILRLWTIFVMFDTRTESVSVAVCSTLSQVYLEKQ